MTESRDPNRELVYTTEHALTRILDGYPGTFSIAGTTMNVPVERRFGDLESIQRYVNHAAAHIGALFPEYLARMRPTVRRRKGTTRAHYEHWENVIAIPDAGTRWAMRETVVLHEMGHWLAGPGEHHGKRFQGILATLLDYCVGYEAGFTFRVLLAESLSASR